MKAASSQWSAGSKRGFVFANCAKSRGLCFVGALLLTFTVFAKAQQPKKVARIGFLASAGAAPSEELVAPPTVVELGQFETPFRLEAR